MVVVSREGVQWIQPAQDTDKWLPRVKVVTKIRDSTKRGEFLD